MDSCQNCGENFSLEYEVTLSEALRQGGIARGVDIEEEDVTTHLEYTAIKKLLLESGDTRFLEIFKVIPEEALKSLSKTLNKVFKKDDFEI